MHIRSKNYGLLAIQPAIALDSETGKNYEYRVDEPNIFFSKFDHYGTYPKATYWPKVNGFLTRIESYHEKLQLLSMRLAS